MLKLLSSPRLLRLLLVLLSAFVLLTVSKTVHLDDFWHAAFHEIGFALLVSFIVWAMFEVHMSQEADTEWSRRIDRISRNVFFAVLRKDLPKQLIDEARAIALDTNVLRTNFNVTYTLRDETFEVVEGQRADCVLMVAVMACEMRNVSGDTIFVPMAVGLPNPVHPGLKALTRVNTFAVTRAGGPIELDLQRAETAFRESLATQEQTVKYDAGGITLAPDETVSVRADYVMAKESEDTELLQSLYPCDGLTVTVMDSGGDHARVLFAKAIHRRPIENQSSPASPGTKVFRIAGYLLPHQGVLIWWKRAPVGAQQDLPGVG